MKDGSYVVIQAFMVNDLHLKGNELIVYATIYGFSQDGGHWFYGTRGYLAEWCGAKRETVDRCIKSLMEKGFIERRDVEEHGHVSVQYRATKNVQGTKFFSTLPSKTGTPTPKTEHINNLVEQPSREEKEHIPFSAIIDHLNERAGTRYRASAPKTQAHIRARWGEGYRLDDFKRVIDVKCAEWMGDVKMSKYLCPDTLFGTKFEKYLNQPMPQVQTRHDGASFAEYDLTRKQPRQQVQTQMGEHDDIDF